MGNFQEIIKVSDGALTWTYLFSENQIGKVFRHWHQGTELTMLLDGEALYTINGKPYLLQKGEIILINMGDYHSCQIDHKPQACEAINIIFPEAYLQCFSPKGKTMFELRQATPAYEVLKQQLNQLYEIFINRNLDPYAQLKINSIVCEITYTLFTEHRSEAFLPDIAWSEKYSKWCKELVEYIDAHYQEDLTLESLGAEFHVSRDHLSRIFRSCMDTTFKKHLTRVRMYHAYKLLIHSDLTLLDISTQCGFSDSRAFINSFKQVYHTTPSQYRNSLERISDIQLRNANKKALFFKQPADIS